MTRIKICGISRFEHAEAAVQSGADFVGIVFAPSPRQVSPEEALPLIGAIHYLKPRPVVAGVFVNFNAEAVNRIAESCQLDWVQLSGNETWEYCKRIERPVLKVIHVAGQSSADIITDIEQGSRTLSGKEFVCLLDTSKKNFYGGTGETFDWRVVKEVTARSKVIVAGGLNPDNVGKLIEEVNPWGVDVSSGIETNGQKDTMKINAFIQAVRKADNALGLSQKSEG